MKRLKKARKQAGLTQTQLAGLMGLRQSAIAKYEAGQRDISSKKLKTLIQILQAHDVFISADALIGGE